MRSPLPEAGTAGQIGGTAEGGLAEIVLQGDAVVDAALIALTSRCPDVERRHGAGPVNPCSRC